MKKVCSLFLLIVLFFLATIPEWSIFQIGEMLAKSQLAALIIQSFLLLLAVGAVVFIFSNPPTWNREKDNGE